MAVSTDLITYGPRRSGASGMEVPSREPVSRFDANCLVPRAASVLVPPIGSLLHQGVPGIRGRDLRFETGSRKACTVVRKLQAKENSIPPAFTHQHLMSARLHDHPVLHNMNAIGVRDRIEAMRND